MILRHFLYLDRDLVTEFLAQIEGGVFTEERELSTEGTGRGASGSVGAGLAKVSAGGRKEQARERERTVRQTAASEFQRLYDVLVERDALTRIEGDASAQVDGVDVGAIVEVVGSWRVPGFSQLAPLIESLQTFQSIVPSADNELVLPTEAEIGLRAIARLAESYEAIPAIVSPGGGAPALAMTLPAEGDTSVAQSELAGEATALMKVLRRVRDGETYLVQDPFLGLAAVIPADQRESLMAIFDDPNLATTGVTRPEVQGPAFVVLPIAIYR